MLQSRHPKHRRWYFFGPYLESLGNRCHLFLHPSAKNSAAAFGWYRDGFFRRLWWWLLRRKKHPRNTHRFVVSLSWWVEEVIYEACVFKADQFDSHLPTWMNSFCLTILLKKTFLLHYEQAELGDLAVWFYELPTRTSQTWISAHQKTSPSKTTTIHQALFLVW